MSLQVGYQLTIDGSPAPAALLNVIQQIEYEDHAVLADMLRLRLATSVKSDGSAWTLLDDATFPRLANLKLSVTIGSGAAIPLISGYVIETDAQFSDAPGYSALEVVAMDPTVLLHLEEKVKTWPNMADSDVASAIFSDAAYGFTAIVEATQFVHNDDDHTLTQRGTDMQFLESLARRNGYEVYLDLDAQGDVEGHFHPPQRQEQPQGTLSVNMGAATNVNKFRARYDMLGPATAQAGTLSVDDGSDQSGSATESTEDGNGPDSTISSDRPRKVLLSGLGMGLTGEIQRYTQGVVDQSAWSIVADGECNTAAYGGVLRAKVPILVRGVGRTFSGRYYVERVLHTISGDGTYTQRFRLRRNALGLTGQEQFGSGPADAT